MARQSNFCNMKKLLILTIIISAIAFQGCMRDQEDNLAGSLQVNTEIYSVNEPRWHDAQDIQFYITTETGFYEGNRTVSMFNAFRQGNFQRQIIVNDLLPGNYFIGFRRQMEMGNDSYTHLPFQIIGGRTTNLTLR